MARRLLAVLLMAVIIGLPTAAYADPVDPTWLGGLWDDDDFDYVILLVTNLKASLPAAVPVFSPTTAAVDVVPVLRSEPPSLQRPLPFYRRGPPLA